MNDARAIIRKDRRARAEGLFSASSVVMNAEFRKIRLAAIKIKPAAPSCNSGQGEASGQKKTDEFIKRDPENNDSKTHKDLAADVLHRLFPHQAL